MTAGSAARSEQIVESGDSIAQLELGDVGADDVDDVCDVVALIDRVARPVMLGTSSVFGAEPETRALVTT